MAPRGRRVALGLGMVAVCLAGSLAFLLAVHPFPLRYDVAPLRGKLQDRWVEISLGKGSWSHLSDDETDEAVREFLSACLESRADLRMEAHGLVARTTFAGHVEISRILRCLDASKAGTETRATR